LLKEIRKTGSKTPVIILAGFNMPDTDTATRSTGTTEHLAKDKLFQNATILWWKSRWGKFCGKYPEKNASNGTRPKPRIA